ncbi:hypothetical protein ACJJTC_007647 [Scirpophaga incertulas]
MDEGNGWSYQAVQEPPENPVFQEVSQVLAPVDESSSELDCFLTFYPDSFWNTLKIETNRYAAQMKAKQARKGILKPGTMLYEWKAKMEERRKTTSVRQLEILIDFLETLRWEECDAKKLELLLSDFGMNYLKFSTLWGRQELANNGGAPSSAAALSPLEARIANNLDRDVGPMSNVRQDQFASNVQSAAEVEAPSIPQQLDQQSAMNTSPPIIVLQVNDEAPGTMPSPTGHTPTTQSPYRTPRNHRSPARISALDESRQIVLRIEELRAETYHKIAEAAKLIAESIDRFSRQYCKQSSGDNV